jgi:hypothetical protein
MRYPRHAQVSTWTTPYSNCVSRCVRRASLCGWDRVTGHSYEHWKQWIVDRPGVLGEVVCIGVCACTVMANHHRVPGYGARLSIAHLRSAGTCCMSGVGCLQLLCGCKP